MMLSEARSIINTLPYEERLAQLAEECAELSQAALKLRRAIDGTNPTPKTVIEAKRNLVEEYGDVLCSMTLIFDTMEIQAAHDIAAGKTIRWGKRLKRKAERENRTVCEENENE